MTRPHPQLCPETAMRLFADDNSGWVVGVIGAAVGGAATVVTAVVIPLLKWRASRKDQQRQEDEAARKQSIDEWREIVARQDAHIADQAGKINLLMAENARLARGVVFLHTTLRGIQSEVVRLGGHCEPIPDLNDLLGERGVTEFDANQSRQGTVLLRKEAEDAAKKPNTGGQKA